MYCTYCGKEIDDDSVFCPFCGKNTNEDDILTYDFTNTHVIKHKEKNFSFLTFFLSFLSLIIFPLGFIFFFIYKNKDKKRATKLLICSFLGFVIFLITCFALFIFYF